ITPFNWEIEFPEVFDRENPGFDAIVGNPPFLGGRRIKSSLGSEYSEWLPDAYPDASKNSDLSGFFFRRSFALLRQKGSLGLIATNTIAQGDTRSSSLRFISKNGGIIYNARKRVRWPGLASVMISIINIWKGDYQGMKFLDGIPTPQITAFLFSKGGNDDPEILRQNAGKGFIGSYILGSGFTFDDTDSNASSIQDMKHLIEKEPRNSERIFPYIGGEEVNSSPNHANYRFAISFFDTSEEDSRQWPDLMEILELKVKPERTRKNNKGDFVLRKPLPQRWWQYADKRPALYKALATLEDRVLVRSLTSKYFCFTFLKNNFIYDQTLVVFALSGFSSFCIVSSRLHEIWAVFFGATMKDDPRYNITKCFETFPFPGNWETDPTLEAVGKTYYEYRADLMVRNNQGLTDTYNRFHDPDERGPDILKLRDLHQQMDAAVLNAYGWQDIATTCGFALDYLDADTDDLPPEAQDRIAIGDLFFPTPDEAAAFDSLVRTGKRKLPWRYRWPETTHDEVLARLLDLNQQRHLEEVRGHKAAGTLNKGKAKGDRTKKTSPKPQANAPTIPGLEIQD
uniref:BREX-1 system adenine-specific DNA-methyltransferase PglX n=1 Tax=Halomicronema sp. CCY15110 TaxID=2767773 RepID=UPI001EF36E9D